MRKRTWILLLALVLIVFPGASPEALAGSISVVVDGQVLATEVSPVIENGRTMVPLRAIFEALDASVEWDDSYQLSFPLYIPEMLHTAIGVRRLKNNLLDCITHC